MDDPCAFGLSSLSFFLWAILYIRSHHEVLDDFVVVVFDPLKTGSPLFFRSKLAAPSSFHQVSNTAVKLVRQVLQEGRF